MATAGKINPIKGTKTTGAYVVTINCQLYKMPWITTNPNIWLIIATFNEKDHGYFWGERREIGRAHV